MTSATEMQLQALRFLQRYAELEGFPATRRELCAHMGWASPSTAQAAIEALERKGFVERARFGVCRVTLAGRSLLTGQGMAA